MTGEIGVEKLERALLSTAQLRNEQSIAFVLQATVGEQHRAVWCDVPWYGYPNHGGCIDAWREHPDRIGKLDAAPAFTRIETALDVLEAARKSAPGRRVRLIARYTATCETLLDGDGR